MALNGKLESTENRTNLLVYDGNNDWENSWGYKLNNNIYEIFLGVVPVTQW